LLNDGPGDTDLAVIVVTQRAIHLDAADTDQADIYLELPNEIHGSFTGDRLITGAHNPTRHNYLAALVGAQERGHIEVVGDNGQLPRWLGTRCATAEMIPDCRGVGVIGLAFSRRELILNDKE